MPRRYLFTSESVTEGHPDKICDRISDAILDALLSVDPNSRVAVEVVVNTGLVLIIGNITSKATLNYTDLVRKTIAEIGYTDAKNGFSADSCAVLLGLDQQFPETDPRINATSQSLQNLSQEQLNQIVPSSSAVIFGFACNETPELMPLPISLAHQIAQQLALLRHSGQLPYLRPDGKTQVSVIYEDGKPVGIDTILISTQHTETIGAITDNNAVQAKIKTDLWEAAVKPVLAKMEMAGDRLVLPSADLNPKFITNPTGKFVIGGPRGDAGLTGRKIIVDTYGGSARHGGGAFSGQDPTRISRSAAYACRYVAKNLVAAGLAERCEIQVSYAFGVATPVDIMVETFGTAKVDREILVQLVQKHFDLRPAAIIQNFNLCYLPGDRGGRFYQNLAAYGHFGRTNLDLPWERTDRVDLLVSSQKE